MEIYMSCLVSRLFLESRSDGLGLVPTGTASASSSSPLLALRKLTPLALYSGRGVGGEGQRH